MAEDPILSIGPENETKLKVTVTLTGDSNVLKSFSLVVKACDTVDGESIILRLYMFVNIKTNALLLKDINITILERVSYDQ